MTETEIQFISHACLKIQADFGCLICDPWILNEPVFNLSTWKFPPALLRPEEVVAGCDILLITHSHEDHLHIPSLDYFPRDIPILLSAFDTHASLRAHTIELTLRKMGFYNIRCLGSFERFELSKHSHLTAIPNAETRAHDWENMGFVLQTEDLTLLNLNDNVNDEALCKQITELYPAIDIGFIQSGGVTMFPGCFRMSEDEMQKAANERKFAFREQRRLLDFVAPKLIAPMAGDFGWLADQYFHNNWANRTTPALFAEMMEKDYKDKSSELLLLQPGDRWSKQAGHRYTTRRIDWHNMLAEAEKVKAIFSPKLQQIDAFLHDVDLSDLENRSRQRCDIVEKHITRDYINFSARFRFSIEGSASNFSFVAKASPNEGFCFDWQDKAEVDQTLFVPEHIWAAILEGKLMWNIIQWVGKAEQKQFTQDMGRFWFWLEYHIDLNNKAIQVNISEQLFPKVGTYCQPKFATFSDEDEYEKIAQFYKC